jgi:hypothetical protein
MGEIQDSLMQDDSHLPLIDNEIFSQILELDDDDERNFSRGMVREFFEQAEKTFGEMDVELCVLKPFRFFCSLICDIVRRRTCMSCLYWGTS